VGAAMMKSGIRFRCRMTERMIKKCRAAAIDPLNHSQRQMRTAALVADLLEEAYSELRRETYAVEPEPADGRTQK
jgi:hypothetical protein